MDGPAKSFSIRRYEPRGRNDVWNLHDTALNVVGAHLGNGEWDEDLDDIEGVCFENGGEFFVGGFAGEIVAMGAIRKSGANRAELKRMRAAPKLQRRGLGQKLLSALEERAAALGYSSLRLDTTVRQAGACTRRNSGG